MTTEQLIAASDLCGYYHIEYTFITNLSQAGLVEIAKVNDTDYVPETELKKLEQIISLHHELDINLEGIEAITHLLEKIAGMQLEMQALKNRLRLYEA